MVQPPLHKRCTKKQQNPLPSAPHKTRLAVWLPSPHGSVIKDALPSAIADNYKGCNNRSASGITAGQLSGMSEAAGRAIGRFAPSPTGALHAGSMVAALASWLDARARRGQWLVRMEDTDQPRCDVAHAHTILRQLSACGLVPDGNVVWQSKRASHYQSALDALVATGKAYACACTRQEIAKYWQSTGRQWERHQEVPYPGTCRTGLHGRKARAMRLLTQGTGAVHWTDRRLGPQNQCVEEVVGDVVLKRADGMWAYQLAVVVDDAAQGVTHVVRGEDLADNTARQILIQQALGFATPQYLHTPIVLDGSGEKLSKQTGAAPVDVTAPLLVLQEAGRHLGLTADQSQVPDQLAAWVKAWASQWL